MTHGIGGGKRVAVMQPYLLPYAGYFRLFHAVDEFVIYDCVQFPRRGRVHRTEVLGPGGGAEWLTLPLARQSRETRDRASCASRPTPAPRSTSGSRAYRGFRSAQGPAAARVVEYLHGPLDDVVGFLERGLAIVCDLLALPFAVTRSSSLDLDPSVRGQERVLAVASARGARIYVNAPGGIELYEAAAFGQRGIDLRFLAPYEGAYRMLLPALLEVDPARIAADVRATTRLIEEAGTT